MAARFASEFNVPFATLEQTARSFAAVRALADRELVYHRCLSSRGHLG